ncbi:MAG: hypothetical protein LBE11_00025 [Prevotellaceae bacterium]|jgi:hypothetical protein|nr:hypothetical protein [Prevotellaceae bacterium]
MLKQKFIIATLIVFSVVFISCSELRKSGYTDKIPKRQKHAISGSEFAEKARILDAEQREKLILEEICSGNFPDFMRKPVTIKTTAIIDGKLIEAKYFVMSDYLMIGNDDDFIRVPMQPKTAQKIADEFGFFLSTPKICDDIYNNAKVKLEPHPLTVARDSFDTFVKHNKIIENQRLQRKGLIAGIKKDVVITGATLRNPKANRVVIYGWHNLDGKPVQPVYSGHVDWYVDYSHGIRLVHQTILINGKPVNYCDVLNDNNMNILLCNEDDCACVGYYVEQ